MRKYLQLVVVLAIFFSAVFVRHLREPAGQPFPREGSAGAVGSQASLSPSPSPQPTAAETMAPTETTPTPQPTPTLTQAEKIAAAVATAAASLPTPTPTRTPLGHAVTEIIALASPSMALIYYQIGNLTACGSGTIFTPDGYILTNWHVINGQTQVQ